MKKYTAFLDNNYYNKIYNCIHYFFWGGRSKNNTLKKISEDFSRKKNLYHYCINLFYKICYTDFVRKILPELRDTLHLSRNCPK